MTKKKLMMLLGSVSLAVMLAVLLVPGCATPTPTPSPTPEVEVYELEYAGGTAGTAQYKYSRVFVDLVNQRGEGKVHITWYSRGEVGGLQQNLTDVSSGSLDMCQGANGLYTPFVPWEAVLADLPFAWTSPTDYVRWAEEIAYPELNKDLAQHNMRTLPPVAYMGSSCLYSTVGPIHSVADLKGKLFRAMSPGVETAWIEALGAKATVLPWSELYSALEQGVIDLMHNPPKYAIESSFYEVCKDMTMTDHKQWMHTVTANLDSWNSLPEDVQELIIGAWREAAAYWSWDTVVTRAAILEKLEKPPYNVTIYHPTPEELREFRDAVMPVYDWARNEYGSDKVDLVLNYTK